MRMSHTQKVRMARSMMTAAERKQGKPKLSPFSSAGWKARRDGIRAGLERRNMEHLGRRMQRVRA